MNKTAAFLSFALVGIGTLFFIMAPILARVNFFVTEHPELAADQPASVFYVESSKPENLKQTFAGTNTQGSKRKLRVLVVPGHDDEYWGTQFNGIKEADITLALGKELGRLLSQNNEFEIILTRDDFGYNPLLASYFSSNADQISLFVKAKKQIMSNLITLGQVSKIGVDEKIFHNNAPTPVAFRLYGINKWANENGIDLAVNIHFNDYPRRKKLSPGDYSGFSIYVPERQYSNSRASKDVAEAVSKQLQTYYPESNMPKEDAVVEDQDLISIGAFNTLDPASILIEYGYIYEPQFLDQNIREKILKELATQTYIGIKNFFGATSPLAGKFNTSLLPYIWKDLLEPGARYNTSILSLQAALVIEGVYPPQGLSKHDCPLSGTYGKCTWKSVTLFQKKYGIDDEPGRFGKRTLEKINELYSQ